MLLDVPSLASLLERKCTTFFHLRSLQLTCHQADRRLYSLREQLKVQVSVLSAYTFDVAHRDEVYSHTEGTNK